MLAGGRRVKTQRGSLAHMANCTKSEHLLGRYDDEYGDFVLFAELDDITRPIVSVPVDVWEDMGMPGEITVTIEPGDRLNQ